MPIDLPKTRKIQRSHCKVLLVLTACLAASTVLTPVAGGQEKSEFQTTKRVRPSEKHTISQLTAKDRTILDKIRKRKDILGYELVLTGKRFYRDTYLDSADLQLYRNQMFYRVRENYDGQVRIELKDRGGIKAGAFTRHINSTPVPLDRVKLAKQGRLTDGDLVIRLKEAIRHRKSDKAQLLVEYYGYNILFRKNGEQPYLLTLISGKYIGLTGKKLKRPFLAADLEAIASPATKKQVRELTRITDFLISEFKFQAANKSIYGRGVEETVLLRPEETMIYPVRVLGGTKGKFFEQFNQADAVAFMPDGRLLAGDTDNARFKIYTLGERSQTIQVIGKEGSNPGEFDHSFILTLPDGYRMHKQVQGIAVNKNGFFYVIDQGNTRVQAFDFQGRVLPEKSITVRYCPKERPNCPDGLFPTIKKGDWASLQGLAIDSEGALYISDKGRNRVYKILPDGRLDPAFKLQAINEVTGQSILDEPESLAVHRELVFVADEINGNIKTFNRRTGAVIGTTDGFGREWLGEGAEGLAVLDKYLFAVDFHQNRIVVFDIKGEKPKFIHALVGDFESADGIAIDPTGKYIALVDQGNHRILLYSQPEILELLESKGGVR